jgi:hypothetical protein
VKIGNKGNKFTWSINSLGINSLGNCLALKADKLGNDSWETKEMEEMIYIHL